MQTQTAKDRWIETSQFIVALVVIWIVLGVVGIFRFLEELPISAILGVMVGAGLIVIGKQYSAIQPPPLEATRRLNGCLIVLLLGSIFITGLTAVTFSLNARAAQGWMGGIGFSIACVHEIIRIWWSVWFPAPSGNDAAADRWRPRGTSSNADDRDKPWRG